MSDIRVQLMPYAQALFNADQDKIITKDEISDYVTANKEITEGLNITATQAIDELEDILKADEASNFKSPNTGSNGKTSVIKDFKNMPLKINQLKAAIAGYDTELESLQANQTQLEASFKAAEDQYKALEEKYSSKADEYKRIIETINKTTENLEKEAAYKQKKLIYEAMANYNPKTDVDWDEYVECYIYNNGGGSVFDYSDLTAVHGLTNKAEFTSMDLKGFASKMASQSQTILELSANVSSQARLISSISDLRSSSQIELNKTQADYDASPLKKLSQAELDFIDNKNIDMTATLDDGSPQYVILKASDGNYHVYDRKTSRAVSYGYDNICPGYCHDLRNFTDVGNNTTEATYDPFGNMTSPGSQEYFYYDHNGIPQSSNATYITNDPLVADLGNGIGTKGYTQFDIDGDGTKDLIDDVTGAIFCFDKDKDGVAGEDGSELFGDNTDLDGDGIADGYANGFEALEALAKKEGLIGNGDTKLDANDLKILEEKYGFKIKTDGYNSDAKSASEAGITEIDFGNSDEITTVKNFDGKGNDIQYKKGASITVNGKKKDLGDIWQQNYGAASSTSSAGTQAMQNAQAIQEAASITSINAKNNSNDINFLITNGDQSIQDDNNEFIRMQKKLKQEQESVKNMFMGSADKEETPEISNEELEQQASAKEKEAQEARRRAEEAGKNNDTKTQQEQEELAEKLEKEANEIRTQMK